MEQCRHLFPSSDDVTLPGRKSDAWMPHLAGLQAPLAPAVVFQGRGAWKSHFPSWHQWPRRDLIVLPVTADWGDVFLSQCARGLLVLWV